MKTIETKELKSKLDNSENFKLLMTYNAWAYNNGHIPGSALADSFEKVKSSLSPNDEIVVYCVNENCQASIQAYHVLEEAGFKKIRRYSPGVEGWEAAGNKVEKSIID